MEEGLHEMSMNFELTMVEPFLKRLSKKMDSGLEDSEIEKIINFTKNIEVEEEKEMTFEVVFNGESLMVIYRVFMDDVNTPELYFFTTKELNEVIEQEMEDYADEMGL